MTTGMLTLNCAPRPTLTHVVLSLLRTCNSQHDDQRQCSFCCYFYDDLSYHYKPKNANLVLCEAGGASCVMLGLMFHIWWHLQAVPAQSDQSPLSHRRTPGLTATHYYCMNPTTRFPGIMINTSQSYLAGDFLFHENNGICRSSCTLSPVVIFANTGQRSRNGCYTARA